jgi:hypothetical protein
MDALTALDDTGAVSIQFLHVGKGMQVMSSIDGGEIGALVSIGHDLRKTFSD